MLQSVHRDNKVWLKYEANKCFGGVEMKAIPNYISFSRIILSFILIFVKPLSITFYVIYIICGFSDIVDGYIARKTGTTSKLGAKIDSVADMTMVGVLIIVIYPIINPSQKVGIWIIAIAIIRLAAMIVAMKKYKIFASIHTYGNKMTGFVLFMFPILIHYVLSIEMIYIICVMASVSAIEELVIQVTSSELNVNKKSIFEE